MASRRSRSTLVVAVMAAGLVALGRATLLRWGATADESRCDLTGDDLVTGAHLIATRAITIECEPSSVWPWIAQLGQGRGGFYSYDCLENLFGCDIHSADRIVAAWQAVGVGDEVRLFPDGGLRVAVADPPHALVLRGTVNTGSGALPFDFSWAFVLRPSNDGSTRLVVRERYRYAHRWIALIVEPVEVISFVMSQKMLRGMRNRAEQAAKQNMGPKTDPSPA